MSASVPLFAHTIWQNLFTSFSRQKGFSRSLISLYFLNLTDRNCSLQSPKSLYGYDYHNETVLLEAMGNTVRRIPEAFEWNLEKGVSVDTGLYKVWEYKPHWLLTGWFFRWRCVQTTVETQSCQRGDYTQNHFYVL